MLQNKLEKRLDLTLKPSRLFFFYVTGVFLCAVISLFFYISLSLNLQLLCFVLLLLSGVIIITNKKYKTISHLSNTAESGWKITVNDQLYQAELVGECIVTYVLIWLNFSCVVENGRKKTFRVLILPDSADKDLLRQLRVRLRFFNAKDAGNKVDFVFTTDESTRFIK